MSASRTVTEGILISALVGWVTAWVLILMAQPDRQASTAHATALVALAVSAPLSLPLGLVAGVAAVVVLKQKHFTLQPSCGSCAGWAQAGCSEHLQPQRCSCSSRDRGQRARGVWLHWLLLPAVSLELSRAR
jgi:hypothetical protein